MDARSIITALRFGQPLSRPEIEWFAKGLASGAVTDAQAGAFAMAVCLNGLGEEGLVVLTEAMRDSGDILKWELPGPVLDKHSTGGVGDGVSLVLAPALAACGAYVPMISGRGLGHTGGTLDKLEAIPGLATEVDEPSLRRMLDEFGCAIVSATGQIAPADKRLYAVRDVTATVESIDLITASILSKKLAAGLEGLVLDVKCGSGAFMKSMEEAQTLSKALVNTANGAGCAATALITDMNQPLASTAGNALEVSECMTVFEGMLETPLAELTCVLGGALLALGGLAPNERVGREMIQGSIANGQAGERFGKMVAFLGGPRDFLENWRACLPTAPVAVDVFAESSGIVQAIDTQVVGMAVVHLGGGRLRGGDRIEPAVGLSNIIRLGASVDSETPLARVHAQSKEDAQRAASIIRDAVVLGDAPVQPPPLIYERIVQ